MTNKAIPYSNVEFFNSLFKEKVEFCDYLLIKSIPLLVHLDWDCREYKFQQYPRE